MNAASTLTPSDPPFPHAWWKSAIVYQIYPASFFDSNGDGVGDLNGVHAKLDYLKDLGVDILWLSPIYRSPQADMGYDISDYRDIDPRYGTLADWDKLLGGVHQRGMKLVMDLVVNHTSDEHEWFQQSKSSKDSRMRDWYIWRPPKYVDGRRLPPNNWKSMFQGSAWEFDPSTEDYYLHLYHSKQPDLNWENPVVRDAVWDVMRIWIDRGCDGFRMDVINLISKAQGLPDAPISDTTQYYQHAAMHFANGPRVHEYIRQMYTGVLSNHDLITVGETPYTNDAEVLAAYVLPRNKELNMVFNFALMDIDCPAGRVRLVKKPWKLADLKAILEQWQTYKREEGYWNAVFIENHDCGRSVTRFGNDSPAWRAISAKMLAVLQVTQTGTLYVYQGQELGMKNFPRTWGIEEYKDVASQNYWKMIKAQRQEKEGKENVDMEDVLDGLQQKARDHARTPMQWDTTPSAGFTTGTPWMRVYEEDAQAGWNVADESRVPNVGGQDSDDTNAKAGEESVLAFWRRAIRVRKAHDVLTYGDFTMRLKSDVRVMAYVRTLGAVRAWVVLNFSATVIELPLVETAADGDELPLCLVAAGDDDNAGGWGCQLVLCNYDSTPGRTQTPGTLVLRGYEARVYIQTTN